MDPPYLVSRGDEAKRQPFTFFVQGDHHTESPWQQTIPPSVAWAAARVFFETGELDKRVTWEET